MKIAIVSLVLHSNYGGILQSYALQTVLERMGHEVEVLSKPLKTKYPSKYKYPFCILKRLLKRVVKGDKTPIFIEKKLKRNTDSFIKKHIHVRYINSFDDVSVHDYDGIVVGSDQVWRPVYFKEQWGCGIENAFLSFTKNWDVKRIAYAPSFGVDYCEYDASEIDICSNLLKQFNRISVRESSGVRLLSDVFHVEGCHVLDPTMLLNKDDYLDLVDTEPMSKGNLLVYFLDNTEEKQQFVSLVAKERKLNPFFVSEKVNGVIPSVEAWLKGFADAEFILTDSFHACVFSIIFKKPFVVVGNKKRGNARFDSLFKLLNTNQNFVCEIRDYKRDCDYLDYVSNNFLDIIKTNSVKFLDF